MHPLEIAIGWAWVAFWIYWLASAASSKQSVRGGRRRQLTGVSVILVFSAAGVLRGGRPAVHSVPLAAAGVRHPIYSGLLAAVLGTALADNLLGLIAVAVLVAYLYYSATAEERNLAAAFPAAYPEYKSRTKTLIPFLL